jgi:hypothetical protein
MKDFLGQPIKRGCFVTYPGRGNTTAEYGLILYRVIDVTSKGVVAERISHQYEGNNEWSYCRKKSTLKKTTKLVVVVPTEAMVDAFDDPDAYNVLVTKWLHGQEEIDWLNL